MRWNKIQDILNLQHIHLDPILRNNAPIPHKIHTYVDTSECCSASSGSKSHEGAPNGLFANTSEWIGHLDMPYHWDLCHGMHKIRPTRMCH